MNELELVREERDALAARVSELHADLEKIRQTVLAERSVALATIKAMEARCKCAEDQLAGMDDLLSSQRGRIVESGAIALWQKATGNPRAIPDLADLLEFLVGELKKGTEA